ncbi:S41 family peptidase [Undibacterium sp. Di24W]|uniref:S41 family peptidase n=1 Tax=Undibacterium sp. Di24W TaxID=3413033 RepID=UPI003BF2D5D3
MRHQHFSWHATVLLFFSTLLSACGGGSGSEPVTNNNTASSQSAAQSYVNSVIDIMQTNSYHRKTLVWNDIRTASMAKLGTTPSASSIDLALKTALTMLGDHHSFISKSNGNLILNDGDQLNCADTGLAKPLLPENIGYIKVRGNFSENGTSGADALATQANELQGAIKNQDKPSLIGWIVDLRGNGGGNMWPMIAGIGPLLGEGTLGYFTNATNERTRWNYTNGQARLDNTIIHTVSNPYPALSPSPKIAVLTDCNAGSSGEAVIVAFRGRPNTRSFGTPSYGVSTGNQSFTLSDGATLYLTVSIFTDRNGVNYGGRIAPDEIIDDAIKVQDRAVAWLRDIQ